eukprot:TRINITY_DN4645_c0_g1_i1.p1 TRINITY_DN4645_c0_g1~~TRINITY_DN4645_c0_g1_i1.p1  ORF type:complete len:370 (-),score=56.45 TRINITY_DN4645_c0_g1_i1:159-1268(-)
MSSILSALRKNGYDVDVAGIRPPGGNSVVFGLKGKLEGIVLKVMVIGRKGLTFEQCASEQRIIMNVRGNELLSSAVQKLSGGSHVLYLGEHLLSVTEDCCLCCFGFEERHFCPDTCIFCKVPRSMHTEAAPRHLVGILDICVGSIDVCSFLDRARSFFIRLHKTRSYYGDDRSEIDERVLHFIFHLCMKLFLVLEQFWSSGWAHCDVKPENFVVDFADGTPIEDLQSYDFHLIDFASRLPLDSSEWPPDRMGKLFCITPQYAMHEDIMVLSDPINARAVDAYGVMITAASFVGSFQLIDHLPHLSPDWCDLTPDEVDGFDICTKVSFLTHFINKSARYRPSPRFLCEMAHRHVKNVYDTGKESLVPPGA